SPFLPAWVIITIVIGIILVLSCCFGLIVFVIRYVQSLKAQVIEVNIDIGKQVNNYLTSSNRYYDIPGIGDKWEIERRFVSIDYTTTLGEGAFGSVYLGRVLAKNIPSAKGRSIIELSSLTNNKDSVAVKMLHGLGYHL
ncbi:hypothetical protein PMAYCL1PPCAC_10582, partial [Pristionchus mayeri]